MDLGLLSSMVSSRIPEGKFKEWLRARFWQQNNPLPNLEPLVKSLSVESDNTLRCELKDGAVIFGLPSETPWQKLRYIKSLGDLSLFQHYGSMISQLCEIYVDEVYERFYKPKPGDVIVDCGANVGIFTVKVARAVGETGKVIAIEPDPRNIEILHKNIAANKLKNVTVIPQGVWDSKSIMTLHMVSGSSGFSSFHEYHYKALGRIVQQYEVQVDTLDNLVKDFAEVACIKMDIEGAEREAVHGLTRLATEPGTKMAIAAYHVVDGKVMCRVVAPYLKKLGLQVKTEGAFVYAERATC